MKRKLYLLGMFAATAFLTACSQEEVTESKVSSYEVVNPANYKGDEFITVAKGDNMELLLQPSTGNVRWQNKKTGEYLDTKMTDVEGMTNKTALSDIVATYYTGPESQKYKSSEVMDSYTFGVETEAIVYEEMENGVRLVYNLASDEITYKHFPAYISKERMEELVIQYLDDAQLKALKNQYSETKTLWKRKTSQDSPLSGMAAPQLYDIFYNVGHYTMDDLLQDNTEYGYEDEMPAAQFIEVVMEYTLDGDDLILRVPTQHLVTNEDYPINKLEILPYFMASNSNDGYLFVPDGSGSLVYLDNIKSKEAQFSAKYYGGDVLQNMELYSSANPQLMLPVYGMKSDDFAVLGVIESGAEVAQLNTYIKNYYPGIDYARAALTFYINDAQKLSQYVGSVTNYTLYKNSTDYYAGDIQLRYSFLSGDDANYTGMAKRYQELLIEDGVLTKSETTAENAPLFLNLLGELDKEKYFLGIPYDSSIALTSFDQAATIIQDMVDAEISNLIVKYDGVVNGGMNQRAVESVKLSSRLGGKSDWNELKKLADSLGVQIFPSVDLATAYTAKSLSKHERSYTMAGSVAVKYTFDPVERQPETEADFLQYIITPSYIEEYVSKFASSYEKLGIANVASSDFMTFISPDYRNKGNISQTTAIPMYDKALDALAGKYNVMLSNPMVSAYADADVLTDIPSGNSQMKTLDVAVPFTQMVLEGCKTFASDYVNKDSESLENTVMKAMETKSALNFRLIDSATVVLEDTTLDNVFFAEYDTWKEDIISAYNQYNEFYQMVKDAEITEHVVVNQNNDLRTVTYSNGVKILFNYGDNNGGIDGVFVPAHSYVVQEGGN